MISKQDLEEIIRYVVDRGLTAVKDNTGEPDPRLDYVAIFSKNEEEFEGLELMTKSLGEEVDEATSKTGFTVRLRQPILTVAGPLKFLKIRKPDPTRPQRGAPDFKVRDYEEFKGKHLKDGRNLTLMIRGGYEMIEIKGVDVLVYLPSQTLGDRLGLNQTKFHLSHLPTNPSSKTL